MIKFIKRNSAPLLFIFIFLVALFFRFYQLDKIPFGLNNDAAWEGSAALDILKGNFSQYLPYATEGWRGEGIIRLFVSFFMLILDNTPITIRLSSMVFGIGLILPVYLLIKNLFDKKLAFLTTFFIAISGWHITMSKTGWRAISVPFFATLIFYFFFNGLKNKKILNFVLAGICLSLGTLYTYDAGRVILPFFILWLIIYFFTTRKFLSTYKLHLLTLFFSFIAASLPMIIYASSNWENFTSRSNFLFIGNQISLAGNLSPLFQNILTSALLFNVKANGNDFFIFRPLVDTPVSFLIPIGFFFAIWQILVKKKLNYLFILFWFIASLLPGIMSVPNGNRAIQAIPSLYFLASAGLIFLIKTLQKIKVGKKLIAVLVLFFCAISTYLTYQDYLGPTRWELPGFYPETLVTTNYIKTIWDDYDIYLTDNYPRELLTYYLYKKGTYSFIKNYTWLENRSSFLTIQPPSQKKGLAFFMFANPQNEDIANNLLAKNQSARKFYLWYKDDNISRPASLVILVPPQNP